MSKSLIVCVHMQTHTFIFSTYTYIEYLHICAYVYQKESTNMQGLFAAFSFGKGRLRRIFWLLLFLLKIFSSVCLRFTHKYLLRQFSVHDSLYSIFHYLQQNVCLLFSITETHQGFHVTQLKFTVCSQKVFQANILGSGGILWRKTSRNHQDRMMNGFWIILQLKSIRKLSNTSSTV